jgi:hypothetical protein
MFAELKAAARFRFPVRAAIFFSALNFFMRVIAFAD